MIDARELIEFEEEIAEIFNRGEIRAPVHLYSGGAEQMIETFKNIRENDWVLCSWRSHWQCLLKGVPKEELKAEILAGRSIALNFPKYKIVSSAIIGGILPIAVGLGMAVQRSGEDSVVHAFLGDMTALTGIAHECMQYAGNFRLPVRFHIEDNGLSVMTSTRKAWGLPEDADLPYCYPSSDWHVDYYRYEATKWPHAGAGSRVQF
jgi:TPP-dependent pyruvate/acetoin dehydrogenase alpha subunit